MPKLIKGGKRHMRKGKVVKYKDDSSVPILKAFEEGKDNPDHIIGIVQKDPFTGKLYVIDKTTGLKIYIIQE